MGTLTIHSSNYWWMCYFYIVKSTGKRNVKQLSGDTLFMELSQFKNWLVVLGNADLSKYLCCLLKSLGTNPIIVTFAVANIFWSTNWWLGKLWGSSRSSVKTRWLRRWLGVRSMMVALAVSIGIPRSMLCWHCSESYHFVEQLPPQLPDPHYPMPRKIATQKHRIDRRTKSHENTWNAKSHLPQNEVFILKSLRRDDTIHRRFF